MIKEIARIDEVVKSDDEETSVGALDDANPAASFLHLVDARLYKIIKWARNLPCFTSSLQEDQILLLQNAWCDLLVLDICGRSMAASGGVFLAKGQCLSARFAELIGLAELVAQIGDLMNLIEGAKIDANEFVCLKVLILLSPGIFMNKDSARLKDEQRVQRTHEDVIDALYTYTSSHYKEQLCKYGEIMTLCSYITNVSIGMKTFLLHKVKELEAVGEAGANSFGLLTELLKGDFLFQSSYTAVVHQA